MQAETPDTETLDGTDVATETIDLSVIIPVSGRFDDVPETLAEYYGSINEVSSSFEFIYVLDGDRPDLQAALLDLRTSYPRLTIVTTARPFGEATAIAVGFETARGQRILTLPAYRQIPGSEIARLLEADVDADMIVGCREPRVDGRVNRIQSRMFSGLVSSIAGLKLRDAACGVRLFGRNVLQEVELYGDFHRFIPILAHHHGFTVAEVELQQAPSDATRRVYPVGVYLRRLLDLLTVYFLVRFTRKPFRFFGLIGSIIFGAGAAVTAWVVVERFVDAQALADRPAFLLGSLLMVFGLQTLSVGLIGEIIIFAHARDRKEYAVRRIIE